ncbi:hypothetical protein EES39_38455 [Streptomyces sp. ADI92-24]|uniref:hypothetical protein n=1 Tax=Streptomyces sp. ADI92-24 TaxID=1522756 RepID=UPI000F938C52|nr:hypothetical protein [Streptomyces sp. ADI92-24]RPK32478.1 hypothetical protein EES39_38455 [Streptomyces sp. ADI92-24]
MNSYPVHYRTADGRRTAEVTETTITVFEGCKTIATVPATAHHHEYPGSVWEVINEAPAPAAAEPLAPVTATIATRHPKSGLSIGYRVTVDTVERAELISEAGVSAGLAARLTIQAGPGQRPVTIMASRLIGEGVWYSDAMTERGGRVHYSRGFGNRQGGPRRLLADFGDVLSICAYDVPGLVEDAEPGQPLKLAKVKAKRKAKAAAKA